VTLRRFAVWTWMCDNREVSGMGNIYQTLNTSSKALLVTHELSHTRSQIE
jgi:hypothetical protein